MSIYFKIFLGILVVDEFPATSTRGVALNDENSLVISFSESKGFYIFRIQTQTDRNLGIRSLSFLACVLFWMGEGLLSFFTCVIQNKAVGFFFDGTKQISKFKTPSILQRRRKCSFFFFFFQQQPPTGKAVNSPFIWGLLKELTW